MQDIVIKIPKEIILSLRIPQEKAKEQLKEELAIHLYKEGFLSFGKSRALASLSKWKFAQRLGAKKIARHYAYEDFEEDLMFANE